MKRSITLAMGSLLLVASLTSATTYAGEPAKAPALHVKVGDLDLTQHAGVETMYKRLQYAAQQVCGPSNIIGSRLTDSAWQSCVNVAVDSAVRQVNRPALTAYHRSHIAQNGVKQG
jgi:UrcA family protein